MFGWLRKVFGGSKRRGGEEVQGGPTASLNVSSASYNALNEQTNNTGGGHVYFRGSLDELGNVTVAGNATVMDSRTTNFAGVASVSLGTNVVPIVATDYSSNIRSNRYQIVATNFASVVPMYDSNGNMTNDGAGLTYEYDAANRM